MNAARHLPFPRTDSSQLFDVDNFLADLERLARQPQVPGQFYSQLLDASSLAIGAKESAYWVGQPGRLRSTYQHGHADSVASTPRIAVQELDHLSRQGRPQVLPGTRTRGPVLASPVFGASEVTGVLTYELSAATPPASAEQLLELAAAVAEIAGEYELRQQVAAAAVATNKLASIEAFILRVHSLWRVEEITRDLAEEGRRLVGCDRLSVLIRSGRSWHVSAVSGVDSPSPRAAAIRSMERLVRVVAVTGEPLILGDGPNEFSPQVQQAVDDYFDGTAPRQLIITPCVPPTADPDESPLPPSATVVLEQFHGPLPSEVLPTLKTLTTHAAAAIARAEAVRRIPLANWLVRRGQSASPGRWTRRALLWGTLAATLCGIAAALLWIPTNFEISAEGRFAPTSRMRAFAPRDSIVKRILVTHGAKVSQGQPLVELRSPELELQIEQVEGELATTRKEVAALETARLRATLPNQKEGTDVGSVAAKLSALRELTASHERQLQLLAKEASRLVVVSPIDGEVLSWKPEDYLQDRPVRRGQRLLEIGATDGDWEIELDVPDRRAGHVLTAAEATQPLHVSYIVKSDPAQRHVGEVKNIATAAQTDSEGNPTLRVDVRPENAVDAAPRSGMMVAANIHCGERSLGYVWFHEAWEAIQRHWF